MVLVQTESESHKTFDGVSWSFERWTTGAVEPEEAGIILYINLKPVFPFL